MTAVLVERNALERAIVVICSFVLWVTMVSIFLILTANTLLRYAFGTSLQWANEVPELLFPWLVMSGVVLAAEKGSHIATVFLVESVRPAVKRVIAIVSWSAVAVLYAVLVRATWNMLEIVHDEKTPILLIPTSVTYGCLMVGMGMLVVLALQSASRAWRGVRVVRNSSEPGAQAAQG